MLSLVTSVPDVSMALKAHNAWKESHMCQKIHKRNLVERRYWLDLPCLKGCGENMAFGTLLPFRMAIAAHTLHCQRHVCMAIQKSPKEIALLMSRSDCSWPCGMQSLSAKAKERTVVVAEES